MCAWNEKIRQVGVRDNERADLLALDPPPVVCTRYANSKDWLKAIRRVYLRDEIGGPTNSAFSRRSSFGDSCASPSSMTEIRSNQAIGMPPSRATPSRCLEVAVTHATRRRDNSACRGSSTNPGTGHNRLYSIAEGA